MKRQRLKSFSQQPIKDDREYSKFDIILDSGAFSAWRKGIEIDLEIYCQFLLENHDWITTSVALDVICPEDPEYSAKQSFENYMYMRKRGLDPVPVLHAGESIDWLYRMMDAGCKYIGLSASSIVSRNQADDWYALIWSHLVDKQGLPVIKAHAFGEGRADSLMQFPWYSADSTSWIYASQQSGIFQIGDKRRISYRNDGLSTQAAPDIDALSDEDREYMMAFLKEAKVDPVFLTKRGGQAAFITRCYLTALYYMELERRITARCPIRFEGYGFLMDDRSTLPPVHIPEFKMHLVMGGNHTAWTALAVAGHTKVLASYYYINTQSHFTQLRNYMHNPEEVLKNTLPFKKHYNVLMETMLK